MNITANQINMFRRISAYGKRNILEVLPQKVEKIEITGLAKKLEYKSIPDGMPLKTNVSTFERWEQTCLEHGETRSYALESWLDMITPRKKVISRIEQEITSCFSKENINKIEFFKTLSQEDKTYIMQRCKMVGTSEEQFIATLSGHKPAWYCDHGFYGKIDFSKIKLNPKIADKFDVVNLSEGQLYFLNKKEVLKIIEENRDVYCAAQGLEQTADVEIIYQTLLRNLEKGNTGHALFGMTLGFPRHSSMVFEMEQILKGSETNLRDNIPLFKEKLLELLHNDKSPFAGYPKETIEMLEKHIINMNLINMNPTGSGSEIVSQCAIFGNEERSVNRLIKLEKDFNEHFKVEDLM